MIVSNHTLTANFRIPQDQDLGKGLGESTQFSSSIFKRFFQKSQPLTHSAAPTPVIEVEIRKRLFLRQAHGTESIEAGGQP